MRWDRDHESENVELRGGLGGKLIGGGVGTIVLVIAAYFLGVDPSTLLQAVNQVAPQQQQQTHSTISRDDPRVHFVSFVLDDTETTWRGIFQDMGREYQAPKLVIFEGAVQSACGQAGAAMGPFYCSMDQKAYIDLSFYDDLQKRFQAPGDFAQAYVIAHEIGHHVQNLLGISEKVREREDGLDEAARNALSVRVELQADCFAGIWGYHADKARQLVENGDVEEALTAASAIGDDRLQQQAQGRVVPESFTHGSSEQRVRWFKRGMASGKISDCNTFKATSL